MIRHKQHILKQPQIHKIHKRTPKVSHTSVTSRLYVSLSSNSLQSVCARYICHFCSNNIETTDIIRNNNQLTIFNDDAQFIKEWFDDNIISYLLTYDMCQFPVFDKIQFPRSIKKIFDVSNAGGNSELSEALSMYYMKLRFCAKNFISEMEIEYIPHKLNSGNRTQMCDYKMIVNNSNIGVSVTRAIMYPINKNISPEFAKCLLWKKLLGMVIAKRSVTPKYNFDLSIIHIWCRHAEDINIINQTYCEIAYNDIYNLFSGIYIICSLCHSEFIYSNIKTV